MIAEADVSGDGRVDYTEFAHLWKTSALYKHHRPLAGRLQQVRYGRCLIRQDESSSVRLLTASYVRVKITRSRIMFFLGQFYLIFVDTECCIFLRTVLISKTVQSQESGFTRDLTEK